MRLALALFSLSAATSLASAFVSRPRASDRQVAGLFAEQRTTPKVSEVFSDAITDADITVEEDGIFTQRRKFFGSALRNTAGMAAALSLPSLAPIDSALAADVPTKFDTFADEDCGFQISVPSSWEKSVQKLSDRRKIVFYVDPESGADDKTLFFAAYTPVRDDFTGLGSFGSVDQVAQMFILPKGELAGEETESKMISAESKKNAYIFDYISKVPQQPKRHFRTIFSLANGATGGAGGVLVTVTAQTPESRYDEMKPVFDEIIDSYGKIKK
eukprot:CAMPEP_0183305276 /NCGR_PEP_ID=MMETSP0160_2-20130417/10070_1 /TAXON_ID=2839 ORGANISM="Odontella Sinensis, Strain Grunow 1884" /NCGR_SAMPLE_ID=MMETSP0160_2 /ASSEMBLY_ACC=CAM_ASM_000250 /LENGTH=271 /DNA_ID=CAMNT_0025468453 /DNA_START=122 /DNA_END=937 /DNA_ORIENTATION=-